MDLERSIKDESFPLLPKSNHDNKPDYSIVKARITSVVIPALCMSAGIARDTLMAQYLVKRLTEDKGFTVNSTEQGPCGNTTLNDTIINGTEIMNANNIHAEASEMLTYFSWTQCIPAFVTCLMIGSYSDFLGRRLLLLLPVVTNLIRTVIITIVIKFHLDLRYSYIAYAIDGVGGSWFAMLLGMFALTADINSEKSDRTFWIYLISCLSTMASAGANVAVGYLIAYLDFFYACLPLLGMAFSAFIILLFTIQETLPVHQRPKGKGRNPCVHLRRIVSFYLLDGSLRKRFVFNLCLLIFVIGVMNGLNIGSLDALYQLGRPFCWGSDQIGNYSAFRSAGTSFFGILFLKLLQLCISEEKIGMFGMLSQGAALTFEAFIKVPWHFYLVPILLIPTSPFTAIVRSMLSNLAGSDSQGAMFSSIAVVETLCQLVSTTIYNKIYALTVSFMPGAVYLVMAGFSCITFVLFGVYFCVREEPHLQHEVVVLEPETLSPVNVSINSSTHPLDYEYGNGDTN
ncbi:proton-coupled folate transporter-like [Physella acuta]|uniref:proton-coupled folate transporter-like n=1 Tax=Physella acuta TaxID=109671 RepID=UPI0027DE9A7B|nr:proton-coupled folate transporter-like [Physella acuta]